MRTGYRTVGDVFEGARPPYSHMGDEDAKLFYSTMNALLAYTNRRLRVVGPGELRPSPERPDGLFAHGAEVAEELWKRRSLVEDFVRENPAGLSEEALACALPWRHALRDMFVAVDANDDRAIYMNRERLFVVGAMQGRADAHVHHIPSLMLLTLLPFKGGIVTDGKTIHLDERPWRGRAAELGGRVRELCARPLVQTAEQLLAYTRRIPDDENRLTPRFQRLIDEGFANGMLV